MNQQLILKKYKNRRIAFKGKYLTYGEIIDLIKSDKTNLITIIDHESGADITAAVLRDVLPYLNIPKHKSLEFINNFEFTVKR